MTVLELTGKRFGRLVVLSRAETKGKGSLWNCLCDCGKTKVVSGCNLRNGGNRSCGCLQKECRHFNVRTHGMAHSPEWETWHSLKRRCIDPNDASYQNYGGRGITVCDEWRDSFQKFYEDMGIKPSSRHSIDRIDVNGNYTKENCRWATPEIQARNRRVASRNKSGCSGVHWNKKAKKWAVCIRYKGKLLHIGHFESLENAISSRMVAESLYWGSSFDYHAEAVQNGDSV